MSEPVNESQQTTRPRRGRPPKIAPMESESGKTLERPTVYKGFYIFADQYVQLLERSAYNKIHGLLPSSSSDIIREALDLYFQENTL